MSKSRLFEIELEGKRLSVELSKRASLALGERLKPLYVEMELYFSCLIRKRVRFPDAITESDYRVSSEAMEIAFRPIMTRRCSVADVEGTPPTSRFPHCTRRKIYS